MIRTIVTPSTAMATLFFLSFACFNTHAGTLAVPGEVTVLVNGSAGGESQPGPPITVPIGDDGLFAAAFDEDEAPGSPASPVWNLTSLSVSGDADPTVTIEFSIANTSATDIADLTIDAFVPILGGPFGPATSTFLSLEVELLDFDDSGDASFAPIDPAPLATGLIDATLSGGTVSGGETALTLGPPLPIGTGGALTFSGPTGGSGIFGPFTVSGTAGEVSSSIALALSGALSAGDAIAVTATFTVEAIPEPASATLLGLFGAVAVLRRRR